MRSLPRLNPLRAAGIVVTPILTAVLVLTGAAGIAAAPASAAPAAAPAPAAIPAPDASHAVVVVYVASDRTGSPIDQVIQAGPLPGVTMRLATRAGAGTTAQPYTYTPRADSWASCVSDADGNCAFSIPITGTGGVGQDAALYVVQGQQPGDLPAGYFQDYRLGTGTATPVNVQPRVYAFRVGRATKRGNTTTWQLRAGQTYRSGTDFMNSAAGSPANPNQPGTAPQYDYSTGNYVIPRVDPPLPTVCGLKVALVVDLSASVGNQIGALRGAANSFVDALAGTPSYVSVYPFATGGAEDLSPTAGTNHGVLPLTSVASPADANGAGRVHAKINGLIPEPNGYTSWGGGLGEVATDKQALSQYNLVVVITDGNPTVYGYGGGSNDGVITMVRDVGAGVAASNAIKAAGVPVLAVGVGDGINSVGSGLNLQAITGPNTAEQTNYYQDPDYTAAARNLQALATENCAGTMTVVKSTVPFGTAAGQTKAQLDQLATPAGGWAMTASTSTAGVTFDDGTGTQTKKTEDGSGAAGFKMSFNTEEDASVGVHEAAQPGYSLLQVAEAASGGAQNAVCEGRTAGDPSSVWRNLTVTDVNTDPASPGFSIDAPPPFMIACYLYNEAPSTEASVRVDKQWVVNGAAPIPDGAQDSALQAELMLDGRTTDTPPGFSTVYPGYEGGQQLSISEKTDFSTIPGCRLVSSDVTAVNGAAVAPAPLGDTGYSATLAVGENSYELTNAVDCTTRLALFKQVDGTATPTDWMLTARPTGTDAGGAAPGPSGVTGSAIASVSPGVDYALSEALRSSAPDSAGNYVQAQADDPSQQPAGATGTWVCRPLNADGGFPSAGASIGGGNGVIDVPLGASIGCITLNSVAHLTLAKTVENGAGGDAAAGDWTLVATPQEPSTGWPAGFSPAPVHVTGTTGGTTVEVRPGIQYAISETGGSSDYALASTACALDGGGAQEQNTVSVEPGGAASCTLTNVQSKDGVAVEKSVRSTEQNADGTWTIRYNVDVLSTYASSPSRYSLDDTLRFGSGIHVLYGTGVSPSWVEGGTDRSGTWDDGAMTTTLATDRTIAASATHRYTVTVHASVTQTAWDDATTACHLAGDDARGGFLNTTTVTTASGEQSASDCSAPARLEVTKTAGTPSWSASTGDWTVPYTVTVTNASASAQYYDLNDTPDFAVGATISGATATGPSGAIAGWNGTTHTTLASGTRIAAATAAGPTAHHYRLAVRADASGLGPGAAVGCGTPQGPGEGFFNRAILSNGGLHSTDDACADIPVPTITHTKSVTSVEQQADGTWTVGYAIRVTNSSSHGGVYSLDDTLRFGAGITIRAASWSGPTRGSWADPSAAVGQVLATGRALAGGATESYAVTVSGIRVPAGVLGTAAAECPADGSPAAAAFDNESGLTVLGTTTTAEDCAQPSRPTIDKQFVSAIQSQTDATHWTASFQFTVDNSQNASDAYYALEEVPQFSQGVTVDSVQVDGVAQSWNGVSVPVVAGSVRIAAGQIVQHTVTFGMTVSTSAAGFEADCSDPWQAGSGLFNYAELTVGADVVRDYECADLAQSVDPTVLKTVRSSMQNADGSWTTVYGIRVDQTDDAVENPARLAGHYDLSDTLDFGDGIAITGASWAKNGGPAVPWAGDFGMAETLASGASIAAGATDEYVVTVTSRPSSDALSGAAALCSTAQNPTAGGFLNRATLTVSGTVDEVSACAQPSAPVIDKQALSTVANDDNTWTISYLLNVRNPASSREAADFVLTDKPAVLPKGVTAVGNWTASSADSGTPAAIRSQWAQGQAATLAQGRLGPGMGYSYVVSVTVRVKHPDDVAASSCGSDSGLAITNTAALVSGELTSGATACAAFGFYDLKIVKSYTGSTIDPGAPSQSAPFRLEISASGTAPAQRVVITDPMPSGLRLDLASLRGADWSFTGSTTTELVASYIANGGVFSPGVDSTITYRARVVSADADAARIVNTAYAVADGRDADPANNVSSATVPLRAAQITTPPPVVRPSATLPDTGQNLSFGAIGAGILLVLVGFVLLFVRRRRRGA